jgi:hypothetical protein
MLGWRWQQLAQDLPLFIDQVRGITRPFPIAYTTPSVPC